MSKFQWSLILILTISGLLTVLFYKTQQPPSNVIKLGSVRITEKQEIPGDVTKSGSIRTTPKECDCTDDGLLLKEHGMVLKEILSHLSTAHRLSRSGKSMLEIQSAYHKTWGLLNNVHRNQESSALFRKPKLDAFDDNDMVTMGAETSGDLLNSRNKTIRICPERFSGPRSGLPYLLTGVDTADCSNVYDVIPLAESVTIWLNFANEISNDNQKVLLDDLSKSNYSHLPIIVSLKPGISLQFSSIVEKLPKLSFFEVDTDSIGAIMLKVAELAKTPYILVSRSLERFTQFANIERLLRISSYLNIDFVGGSQRRLDGHWMHSCYQYKMLNYTLRMISGYDVSYNACMYCDYVSGPFLTRPNTLLDVLTKKAEMKQVSMSSIHAHLFYLDLFIQINQNYSTMSCPDVMFHTRDIGLPGSEVARIKWKPLIIKWRLNRLVLSNGVDWSYSCAESETKCDLKAGLLNPICCTTELNEALLFAAQFMDKHDIEYTMADGTLLGSVKVSNSLSWEKDHDVRVRRTHYQKFHEIANKNGAFLNRGYRLAWDKCENQSLCTFDFLHVYTKNWFLEFFAKWDDCNPNDIWQNYSGNITKTRAQIGGYWLIAYPNPAGASRNRYGPSILEHVEHWRVISKSTDTHPDYGEGRWNKCPEPGFHGCLDNFLPMGNIQFQDVWI